MISKWVSKSVSHWRLSLLERLVTLKKINKSRGNYFADWGFVNVLYNWFKFGKQSPESFLFLNFHLDPVKSGHLQLKISHRHFQLFPPASGIGHISISRMGNILLLFQHLRECIGLDSFNGVKWIFKSWRRGMSFSVSSQNEYEARKALCQKDCIVLN